MLGDHCFRPTSHSQILSVWVLTAKPLLFSPLEIPPSSLVGFLHLSKRQVIERAVCTGFHIYKMRNDLLHTSVERIKSVNYTWWLQQRQEHSTCSLSVSYHHFCFHFPGPLLSESEFTELAPHHIMGISAFFCPLQKCWFQDTCLYRW